MKNIMLVLLIIISSRFLYAQESHTGELIIKFSNTNVDEEITVKLQLLSLCWNADRFNTDVHNLTDAYPGFTKIAVNQDATWFHACWDNPNDPDVFGLGRYKVTASIEKEDRTILEDYFFIDYRTSDFPEATEEGGGNDCKIDFALYFDASDGKFYYDLFSQYEFPVSVAFWDSTIRPCVDNIKTELEPLPPDNFQVTSSNNYPYLSWDHSTAGDFWTNYAIYRSVTGGCQSSPGSFTRIATVSGTTTSYTDTDYLTGGPITAHYKIFAINGSRASESTDIESICVGLFKEGADTKDYAYNLNQNYPNPFNPQTNITFSIKDDAFVSLKIYDLLGREVANLVEEYKSAGEFSVEFNAQQMESGIYFYELKAGKFRDVKKLMVIK